MSRARPTYDLSLLDRSPAEWKALSALRVVYADICREIRSPRKPGNILEVGSGVGAAQDHFSGFVTSNIVPTRFVDRAVSTYAIQCENWHNVIAIDMLHHFLEPLRFLESAAAALASGGRIILAESAGTRWGFRD